MAITKWLPSETWIRPRPTARQRRIDVLLGVVIAVSSVFAVELQYSGAPGVDMGWQDVEGYLWAAGLGLVLCARRMFPLTVLGLTSLLFFGLGVRLMFLGTSVFVQIAMFMAIYTAWAWARRRRELYVVSAVVVVGMFAWVAWQFTSDDFTPPLVSPGLFDPTFALIVYSVMINIIYFFGAIAWGIVSWRGARQREDLQAYAEQLRREQEANAQRAVAEERVRIARELHDVVAHHVSSIGVQAAGARRLLDRAPESAAGALRTIEVSSRTAVSEMHQLVGLLRAYETNGDGTDRSPTPGLDDLERLVADASGDRLRVELGVVGEPFEVSGTAGLSIYRTVQEALSNVREHSTASRAKVILRYLSVDERSHVEVEITDDGSPQKSGRGDDGGWGLQGIRERVQLHRGESEIGPRPSGGFRVRVRLPMEAET